MLLLIAATQGSTNDAPVWIGIIAFALPILILISLFFLIRYQFRVMKNMENAMTRIADAIEAIAHRR